MNIGLKDTVSKLFIDPKWGQKLLVGGLFYFALHFINLIIGVFEYLSTKGTDYTNIPMLSLFSALVFKLSIFVIMLFLSAIPIGYVLQSVHNQVNKTGDFLPEWNNNMYFYFINGLKYSLIQFIYTLTFFVIVFIPFTIGFIFLRELNSDSFVIFSNIVLFVLLGILLFLIILFLWPLIFISFAENFKIAEAFNLKKFYHILSKKFSDFVICYLLVIVVAVIQIILAVVLTCTCIGILFAPFLNLPALLVIMKLFTEVYMEAETNQ